MFYQICDCMLSIFTWWVTVRHLRDVPRRARREEYLSADVKTKESYFPWYNKQTLQQASISVAPVQISPAEQVCKLAQLPNSVSLMGAFQKLKRCAIFLTWSCSWQGAGSNFSLNTAFALCSSWLWGVSISRPIACPWELVKTRLLLQRLPTGGVRSWKEEGRSWGPCWWWWWCCWIGSCQLCS